MSFRERLREELDFQSVSLKELSYKTGISIRTLESYINSRAQLPKADAAVKIAKALRVTVEFLVSEDESEPKRPTTYFENDGTLLGEKKKKELISLIRRRSFELGVEAKKIHDVNFTDTFLEYNTYEELRDILNWRNKELLKLQEETRKLLSQGKISLFKEPGSELNKQYLETAAEKYYKSGNCIMSDEEKYVQQSLLPESDVGKLYSLSIEQIQAIIKLLDTFTKKDETPN